MSSDDLTGLEFAFGFNGKQIPPSDTITTQATETKFSGICALLLLAFSVQSSGNQEKGSPETPLK